MKALILFLMVLLIPAQASAKELAFPYDDAMVSELSEILAEALAPYNLRIKGHVLSVDGDSVFLSVGQNNFVSVGMRFKIEIPDFDTDTIVQVDRVESDFCHAKHVSGPTPDVMFGAENIREDKFFQLVLPESTSEHASGFLLRVADEVETGGGWKVSSITNTVWRYAMQDAGSRNAEAVCELSCSDDMIGIPMVWVNINLPDGSSSVGGFTYRGDWIHISSGFFSDDSHPDWYSNESSVPGDTYAIDAFDVDLDGTDEIILGQGNGVGIYAKAGDFLRPVAVFEFERIAGSGPGYDLGWLEVYRDDSEMRVAARGPWHSLTGILSFDGKDVIEFPPINLVPVASSWDDSSIVLAALATGYHLHNRIDMQWASDDTVISKTAPVGFSFFTEGNFLGGEKPIGVLSDPRSRLWLESDSGWKNLGALVGAGIWGADIDADGVDELVTSSRNLISDRLEFFDVRSGYEILLGVSPTFNGRILDFAFGDFDGDGSPEPCVLVASGTSRKLIF